MSLSPARNTTAPNFAQPVNGLTPFAMPTLEHLTEAFDRPRAG